MPTITLNKTVFEKLVGKKLPLEQLKDRISMLGTDLEKIENDLIEVEVFPNRPDMLSEQGFARAFSSFIGLKTGLRSYPVKKSSWQVIIDRSVQSIRPFTACAVIKGLKFDSEKIREVIQIQEKLHFTYGRNRKKLAIGIYPLEKIRFPITYLAEDPKKIFFQPLDFPKKINALQLLSQHKAGREFGHLLRGLPKFPVFKDAKGEILSLPPIINSHLTGRITEQTKDIFIECSGFDFKALKKCLNILVTTLADLGGEIYSLELVYSKKETTPNLAPEKMKLDLDYVNQRLGLTLKEKEVKTLLEKMGYGYQKGLVLVPAYRADILHPIDLVEDIAIAYGYENFKEELPNINTLGEEDSSEKFYRKIRELLIGFRLLEVKNYHLLKEDELNQKMCLKERLVSLKNALGDYNHLRNSLLPNLLKNLSENQHHESPQFIFEIGRIFCFDHKTETGLAEKEHLALLLSDEKADFTQIKQLLEGLLSNLGLKCSIKEASHPSFIPGRVGHILINSQEVGLIGEISPQVLTNWNLVAPVAGLELDLTALNSFSKQN